MNGLLAEDSREAFILDAGVGRAAERVLDGGLPSSLTSLSFGPYRISSVLGEGGMGVVYLARRADLGSVAAIKILRDAWLSPARRERFASEQRTLAQLRHPAIAQIYDADTLPDGTPWFVMEYVDGLRLTDYAARRAPTIAERLRLFRAVAEAVQHAHSHAVIHRDLKPSNILVTATGEVKLLDFGIAKQLEPSGLAAEQTRTGLRLMTPAYAAPEQVRGGPVGTHTDVYSLGVVLYELLTGKLPFDLSNRTPGEADAVIVEQEPLRPSAAAARTPKGFWSDLDVLCLTAMHKDPNRRYRTADALIRDVDHYLAGEPLEARPDSIRYRVGKFARRRWRPLVAAALAVIALGGTAVFYTLRLASARNAAVAEAARTARVQRFMLALFQGGDEAAGPSDSLRVVTLVDRGLQTARELDREPLIQAELYGTLGGIYQKLGHLDRADTLLRLALDRRRELLGGDNRDVAASLIALGMLRNAQADYGEAERLVRDGLHMGQRIGDPADPFIGGATASLGQVLEDRGDYDKAIPVLDSAVSLLARSDSASPALSMAMSELANSHFYAGHFPLSDSLNRRVLVMDRAIYGARHPHVADDLINLGAVQSESGHFAEAERYYRQGLDIMQAWYGPTHPETASALTMIGRVVVQQGRLDEGAEMLSRALAIQERVYGPVHPRVASALNELGTVARQRGRWREAEADFKRMAAIYKSVYADKHYLIGIALSNLAGVYDMRKRYPEAERLFREVLRRYSDVLAPDHQLVGIALVRLGRTLQHESRYADAAAQSAAGYDILMKQSAPPAAWLNNARHDLAIDYERLRQPANAAKFRALASSAPEPPRR